MDNNQIEREQCVVHNIERFLLLVLIVVLGGTLLPRIKTETKQCILNTPVDVVFAIMTNNQEWHYRSSLDDFEIIRTQRGIEEWEETANGVTI